jgi:hypothetical protein
MPLLQGANFCVACGTSVRAGSKVTRARNRTEDVDPATAKPTLRPAAAGVAPQDNRRTALVVGAVTATIVLAGVVGQAAAAAAADEDKPPASSPIDLQTQVGSGPTTDEAPDPVPAPGPSPDASEGASSDAAPSLAQGFGQVASADLTTSPDPDTDDDSGGIDTTTGDDNTVVVGGDISFEKPDDYVVEQQLDGFVQVFGDGGYFFAIINPAPTDVNAMVTENLSGLESMGLQDLAISEPEESQIPSSAVVQCVIIGFQGTMATQQGGTVPLEGFAYYFVLQDGSGVTAFTLYEQGALDDEGSPLIVGYDQMFNTLVSTF